jgi:hypothetical protein
MGRSGCEQVRHTNVVFVSTEVDKIAQPAGLSSIRRKNPSPKLRCVGRAHTPSRTNARPNSAGRIAVAMFPSGRDERWVSDFLWHYDVLWGLDYLRKAGVEPDERVAEAIELPKKKTRPRRAMAAREPPRRCGPLRHGQRRRQTQPLEHTPRRTNVGLVFNT